MKEVLVIGANGYIGKNLCYKLKDLGYNVTASVRFLNKNNIYGINYINIDLKDISENYLFIENKYDYIFYLAWNGVSSKLKDNFDIQIENIIYIQNFLSNLKNIPKKIIFIGSASEYDAIEGKLNSDSLPYVSDYYGYAKASSRILIDFLCKKNRIDYNYIIASSIFGNQRDDGNIISYTIKNLMNKQKTQYTNLEQIWNYIYIDDFVDGLIAILKKGIANKTYILGGKENLPLHKYIEKIHNIFGIKTIQGLGKLSYKSNKIDNIIIEDEQVYIDTGFMPKISFEEGIKMTIQYLKKGVIDG